MSEEDIAKAFETQFRGLISFVEKSTTEVQDGSMPDLSDLDTKVSSLCSEVEASDKEIAEHVQPLMSEMIAKLDQLAQELNNFQQKALEQE